MASPHKPLSGLTPLAAAGGRRRVMPARGLFLLSLRRRWRGMLDLTKERSAGWALRRAGSRGMVWNGAGMPPTVWRGTKLSGQA